MPLKPPSKAMTNMMRMIVPIDIFDLQVFGKTPRRVGRSSIEKGRNICRRLRPLDQRPLQDLRLMPLDDISRKSDESRVAYPLPPGEIDGTPVDEVRHK